MKLIRLLQAGRHPSTAMIVSRFLLLPVITEDPACDAKEAQKHLEQMLLQEGIKNVTVNIFSQADKYIDRLSRLAEMDETDHKEREGIIALLYSVSI